jgi:Flp pilus assembly protein TadB
VIVALVCGAGVGVGLLAIVHGLWPGRMPLSVALARLDRVPAPMPIVGTAQPSGWGRAVGPPLARLIDALGLQLPSLRRDLAVTDRAWESHLAEKAALGLFGLALVPATATVMAAGGAHLPLVIPAWAALAMGIALFFAPDLGVRAEAAARRRDVRHALGSFLDLVVVGLAGGSGVEGALDDAANVGSGWAYGQIRHALAAARVTRETPWAALARLGDEVGVAELGELAASVGLAGAEGARVRQSLAAKAASVRTHALADAEEQAQAASERMSLPVVLLFAGFLVFVAYPALARVTAGF